MKKSLIFAAVLMFTASVVLAGQNFDQRVSEARRHKREACQAVQKAVKTAGDERPAFKEFAAAEASDAERLWAELAGEYGASVPEGYAGDPGWAQRLEDVRLDLVRIQKEIAEGEWRLAFLSCAHACNLITTMHEANGMTLAIDVLAVLRKKVGFARGLLASEKPEKARALVKEIMAARDTVLLVPPPDTWTREAYLEALPELWHSVDALARAVSDRSDLKTALDKLAIIVE